METCPTSFPKKRGDKLQVQKVGMVGNLVGGGHGKESRER